MAEQEDVVSIPREELLRGRRRLAEHGEEVTPDELLEAIDEICSCIQAELRSHGRRASKQDIHEALKRLAERGLF